MDLAPEQERLAAVPGRQGEGPRRHRSAVVGVADPGLKAGAAAASGLARACTRFGQEQDLIERRRLDRLMLPACRLPPFGEVAAGSGPLLAAIQQALDQSRAGDALGGPVRVAIQRIEQALQLRRCPGFPLDARQLRLQRVGVDARAEALGQRGFHAQLVFNPPRDLRGRGRAHRGAPRVLRPLACEESLYLGPAQLAFGAGHARLRRRGVGQGAQRTEADEQQSTSHDVDGSSHRERWAERRTRIPGRREPGRASILNRKFKRAGLIAICREPGSEPALRSCAWPWRRSKVCAPRACQAHTRPCLPHVVD